MPQNQDRLLQILKSLKPPETGAIPTQDGHGPTLSDSAQMQSASGSHAVMGSVLPHPTGAQQVKKPGRIEMRVEEVGVFFLAAVVMVVIAFLMGWYGRGMAGGAATAGTRTETPVVPPNVSIISMDRPTAQNLGAREPTVQPASRSKRQIYSILVARFPTGGEVEAEDHRKLLEERGYSPAWIRRTTGGVELCLGRFDIPTDALALEWLPRLRRLHGAYTSSQMVKVPTE